MQVCLLLLGLGVAVVAWLAYWVLILQAGGYDQLMMHSPALAEDGIDDIIVFGPDPALPLSAMGTMTLTLYSAHVLALSAEVHYDRPCLWFFHQIGVAALLATAWHRALGQGPLERVVARGAGLTRRLVLAGHRTR